MNRLLTVLLVLAGLAAGATVALAAGESSPIPEIPAKGMVTMLDIGADKCIPCKMMAPILEELKSEYKGKAAIVFIDVWKNPGEGQKYRVRAIPTQIFYDKEGNEVHRHEGFLDKKSIVAMLEKFGVK